MRPVTLIPAILIPLWLLLVPVAALAQPEEPQPSEQERLAQEQQERLATLAGILESIEAAREDVRQLESDRQSAATEEEKTSISEEIESLGERIGKLESDFTVLATGIDPDTFFEKRQEDFDWKEELEAVFAPLVTELKEATARPREMENLRAQLVFYESRLPRIDEALENLERLGERNEDSAVDERFTELTELWQQHRDELRSQREAAEQRLAEMEKEETSFGQTAGNVLRLFFRKRGANLLFALLAFGTIFAGLRYLHRLFHRYFPAEAQRSHTRQLLFRLADVAYYLFTIAVAVGALLVVLYLSSDWVLLTLAVLLLIGLVWAARNAIPVFLKQGQLLLNVGAVREGERLIYQGIPWRVAVLSFATDLENPSLRGGTIRLPLEDLIGMRSRPFDEAEPWFPTEVGHWVILEDGTYGEVVEQTPEVVVVSTARQSYRYYPTVDFVAQHPKNLSCECFSVNHVVGVDYRYRGIVMTEIASKLKATLEEGFRKTAYGEHLLVVIVEFKEMNASSLDLITIAKFRGGAASEYTEIGWKLQQLALECCNENGWEIPFPQMVVHRPESAES